MVGEKAKLMYLLSKVENIQDNLASFRRDWEWFKTQNTYSHKSINLASFDCVEMMLELFRTAVEQAVDVETERLNSELVAGRCLLTAKPPSPGSNPGATFNLPQRAICPVLPRPYGVINKVEVWWGVY